MNFDFKKYHYRSINAQNAIERLAINRELKDFYETLSDEDKKNFNQELEAYLKCETEKYQSIMQQSQQ